jgi:hypothetical protein
LPKYRRYSRASDQTERCAGGKSDSAKIKLGGDLAEIGAYNESFKES